MTTNEESALKLLLEIHDRIYKKGYNDALELARKTILSVDSGRGNEKFAAIEIDKAKL